MKKLTPEQVIFAYNKISGHNYTINSKEINFVKIQNILKKAWERTSGSTQYIYPYLQLKAAVVCLEIVKQKPFPDYNLNVAVLVSLTMLELNGIIVKLNETDAAGLSFLISKNRTEYADLAEWFISHTENDK